jgi:bacterioferritin-associated ferredoxin
MYVCSCKAITEAQVRCASARTRGVRDLAIELGLDDPSCCGRCFRDLDRLALFVVEARPERTPEPALAR